MLIFSLNNAQITWLFFLEASEMLLLVSSGSFLIIIVMYIHKSFSDRLYCTLFVSATPWSCFLLIFHTSPAFSPALNSFSAFPCPSGNRPFPSRPSFLVLKWVYFPSELEYLGLRVVASAISSCPEFTSSLSSLCPVFHDMHWSRLRWRIVFPVICAVDLVFVLLWLQPWGESTGTATVHWFCRVCVPSYQQKGKKLPEVLK